MRTRKMIVPRYVIERHLPHPEPWGESIVLLSNGMTTDVYTDSDGMLKTNTNHQDLIMYLKSLKEVLNQNEMIKNEIRLTTINLKDQELLKTWFSLSPFKRMNDQSDSQNLIREYISHSKTINSEVFIIEINAIKVGIIGFTVIDQIAVTHAEIYNHAVIDEIQFIEIISMFKKHLIHRFNLKKIIFMVHEYDLLIKDAFKKTQFKKSRRTPIILPTHTGFILAFEYEYIIKK